MNNNQTKRLYKTRARRGREKLNKELDKKMLMVCIASAFFMINLAIEIYFNF